MQLWSNRLTRNVVWLTGAETISRLIVFLAVVSLTNYLGDNVYGELSYGFAIANLLVVIADFGLANYVVRELARRLADRQSIIQQAVSFKGVLSLVAVAAIIAVGLMTTPLALPIIIGGGAAIVLTNIRMFFEAIFRAQGRMWLEAITKLSHAILLAATITYCIMTQASVSSVALGYAAVALLMVLIGAFLVIVVTPLQRPWVVQPPVALLASTWPFAASLAINAQFNYLDSALMGWFGQITAVAWYTAAYKPIFFMTALAGMIINAFLPTIAQQWHEQPDRLPHTVSRVLHINLLVALPLAVGGTMLAPDIIAFLYTPEYTPAIPAFRILLWSTVGIYVWAVFGNSLQVCGRDRVYLKNFGYAFIVTLIGNILLIPILSLYGAAIVTLATQVLLCVLMVRSYLQLSSPIRFGKILLKLILSSTVMAIGLLLLPASLPFLVHIVIGAGVYGAMIMMTKSVYGQS